MNKQSKRILILGAGPAGLAAAQILSKHFEVVDIYEKDSVVGGMCRSLSIGDNIVDLGPHRFFSKIDQVNEFWTTFAGESLITVKRQTRIFYNQKYFSYPLDVVDTFFKLGMISSIISFFSLLKAKIVEKRGDDFRSWTVGQFGQHLYNLFFKDYTKKLWGISGEQLDKSFAQQRIRKLNFFSIIFKNKARSLIESFYYCDKGTGQIYHNVAKECLDNGANIFLNTEVKELVFKNNSVVLVHNGKKIEYDEVISTIPLTIFSKMIDERFNELATGLNFRNTILVYLILPKGNYFSDNWIYVNDKNTLIGRITNFSNWGDLNKNASNTILCCELWCSDSDSLWITDENIIFDFVKKDIETLGLIDSSLIESFQVIKLKNSYPIYELGYREKIEKIENELQAYSNVFYIGRSGSFQYNNQDHSIYMGLKLAEHIISNGNSADWKIKFNYKKYIEEEDK